MPGIDVFEAFGSQKAKLTAVNSSNSLNLRYFVSGTEDRLEATESLIAEITNAERLRTGSEVVVVVDSLEMEEVGPGIWDCSLDYVSPEKAEGHQPKSVGEVTFAFDGSGGTFLLTEAYSQTKYGTNAPDHKKSINVNEGKAEGVEIVIPQLTFSCSQRFEGASITFAWLRSLIFATGTVNSDTFLGFAAGEVLFLGPSGQQPLRFMDDGTVSAGERDVEFRFAASPNLTGITIGDITGIAKAGHDFLWIQREESVDATGKALTSKPIGVYVAQVYRRSAFSSLRISNPDVNFPVAGAA